MTRGAVKRNPVPPSKYAKVKDAIEGFREFTGHEPEFVDEVTYPAPDVVYAFGHCDGILYTTVRDGKTESYIHKFKKRARPLICSTHDGTQIVLLGDGYNFTERGIVDK